MPYVTHTIPLNDIDLHFADRRCDCKPLVDNESGVIVHHAKDGRERFERQGKPVEGKGWVNVGQML